MKNIKFGLFALALLCVVGIAISRVDAQVRREMEPRDRRTFVFDGRGAQLGVMVSDLEATATTSGVKIDEVNAGGPAEKAGIKAGDIVVDYDGERVRSARQFTRLVQETPEGRSVAIGLVRDGKKQTVNATPEAGRMTWDFGPEVDRAMREAERGMRNFRFEMPRQGTRGRLGVTVQSITPELAEYFGAKNGGALVSSVTRDSAAAKAGIKPGDVIVSINGKTVSDTRGLMDALEDVEGEATMVVVRDKKEMTLKASVSSY